MFVGREKRAWCRRTPDVCIAGGSREPLIGRLTSLLYVCGRGEAGVAVQGPGLLFTCGFQEHPYLGRSCLLMYVCGQGEAGVAVPDTGSLHNCGSQEHPMIGRLCLLMHAYGQGEAGVVVPDQGYLTSAHALLRRHNALLIADEVAPRSPFPLPCL